VAQAIHENSPRRDQPFVRENVAAIPGSLLESELFGYKKGAFTGATSDRKGLFEQAHRGTIFLDEIGEMSPDMQSKLLRVLQNGEIRAVGGRDVTMVDVRLISASNRDLRRMVEDSGFREDLFYRLNGISVEMPPLRERMEDIPLLVEHFLELAARKSGEAAKDVDPLAMRYLLSYHWPGNVRELLNEIHRAVALSGGAITPDDLSREITEGRPLAAEATGADAGLKDLVKMATSQKEREIILRTLEESDWRKSVTARKLKISRPTLDQKIRIFGLGPFIERGRQK
jgi:transcriptional regulator with PAS, ATPase and Fis domain